jgi:hypothetical protein
MRTCPILVLVGLLIGCDRAQTAGPATQPAGNAQTSAAVIQPASPTTAPAEPIPAVVWVDQKSLTFPPAILQLRTRDAQLTAILMSDDPKSAIDDNYHGNSFYLEMPLGLNDPKELSSYIYRFDAPTSERTDSPNGIFLDGNRLQLQPSQLQVKFEGDEKSMGVMLSGSFLEFETRDDTAAPKQVRVVSKMEVQVKQK